MATRLPTHKLSRRTLLAGVAGATALAITPLKAASLTPANKVCAFVKFVQTLRYDEIAERIAESGFDGLEAAARERGQILPERAPDELPKLVEYLPGDGVTEYRAAMKNDLAKLKGWLAEG